MSDPQGTDSVVDPLGRLREITVARDDSDVLERLGAAGLVNLARDLPSQDVIEDAGRDGTDLTATFADDDALALDAAPVGRVNPRRSRVKLPGGRLGQSSVPLSVPVGIRTTDQGFASIFIQRSGEVGFDWFSAVVL